MVENITQDISCPGTSDCTGQLKAPAAAPCERMRQPVGWTALTDNYNQLLQEFEEWLTSNNRQQGRLPSREISNSDSDPDVAYHDTVDTNQQEGFQVIRTKPRMGSGGSQKTNKQSSRQSSKQSSEQSSKQSSTKTTPGPSPRQTQHSCNNSGMVGSQPRPAAYCLMSKVQQSCRLKAHNQGTQPAGTTAAVRRLECQQTADSVKGTVGASHAWQLLALDQQLNLEQTSHVLPEPVSALAGQHPWQAAVAASAAYQPQHHQPHAKKNHASGGALETVLGAAKYFLGHKKQLVQLRHQHSSQQQQQQQQQLDTAIQLEDAAAGVLQLGCPSTPAADANAAAEGAVQAVSQASEAPAKTHMEATLASSGTEACICSEESSMLQLPLPPPIPMPQQQTDTAVGPSKTPVQQQTCTCSSTSPSKHGAKTPRQSRIQTSSAVVRPPSSKIFEGITAAIKSGTGGTTVSCHKSSATEKDAGPGGIKHTRKGDSAQQPQQISARQRVNSSTKAGNPNAAATAAGPWEQGVGTADVAGNTATANQERTRAANAMPLLTLHQLQDSKPAAAEHASTARAADSTASKPEPSTAHLHAAAATSARLLSCPGDNEKSGSTESIHAAAMASVQAHGSTTSRMHSISCHAEAEQQTQHSACHVRATNNAACVVAGGNNPGSGSISTLTARKGSRNSRSRNAFLVEETPWPKQQSSAADTAISTHSDPLQHIKQLQLLRRRSCGPAMEGIKPSGAAATVSRAVSATAAACVQAVLPAAGAPAGARSHHCRMSSLGSAASGHSSVESTPRNAVGAGTAWAPTTGSRRSSSTQLQTLEEGVAVLACAATAGVVLPKIASRSTSSSRRGSSTDDTSVGDAVECGLGCHSNIQQRKALADVETSVSSEYSLSSILSNSSCENGGGIDTGPSLRYEPSNFGVCSDNPAGAVQLHRPPLLGKLGKLKNRLSSRHLVLEGEPPVEPPQQQAMVTVVWPTIQAALPCGKGAEPLRGVCTPEKCAAAPDTSNLTVEQAATPTAAPMTVAMSTIVHHGRGLSGKVAPLQQATTTHCIDAAASVMQHDWSSSRGYAAGALGTSSDCTQQQRSSQVASAPAPAADRIRARWHVPPPPQQQHWSGGHAQPGDHQLAQQQLLHHPAPVRAWSCRQATAAQPEHLTAGQSKQTNQHHGRLGISHSFNTSSLQQRQRQQQQLQLQEQQWPDAQLQGTACQPLQPQQQTWQQQQQLQHWQQQQPWLHQLQQQQQWQQQPPALRPPQQLQQLQQVSPSSFPPLACVPAAVSVDQHHMPQLPDVDGRRQVVEPLSAMYSTPPVASIPAATAAAWQVTMLGPMGSGQTAATAASVADLSATAVAGVPTGFMSPVPEHGALSHFTDPWAERQQQQHQQHWQQQQSFQQQQQQQLQATASTQLDQQARTHLQEPAAGIVNQQMLPPVTTCSAAAMARQRQEMQQQAFEGLSLEAVLNTAKKIKPAGSKRQMSLIDVDALPASAERNSACKL